jgi:hypothetical protein
MLSEEALILVGAFGALGLLVLGIWELLWPSRPRYPDRRAVPAYRARIERRPARPDVAASPAVLSSAAPAARPAPGAGTPPAPVEAPAAAEPRARGGQEMMDRRLWRSYTNLGLRQIEERKFEAALDPLFQALRLPVAPDQLFETRVALVRAFEGIVDDASGEIRTMVAAADTPRAELRVEKLWSTLRSGIEQGVPQDDLAELLTRTQRLFEEITPRRA